MRPALAAVISKVKEDNISGSSEMTTRMLQELRSLLNYDRSIQRGEWFKFVTELKSAKQGVASFVSISRKIESLAANASNSKWNDRIAEYVDQTMVDEMEAANLIGERFFEAHHSTSSVLTLSYSSTVMSTLFRLKQENDLHVFVCESLPLGEGRQTVAKLKKHNIDAKLIMDAMMGSVIEEVDCCLVGADAVTPDGVINKVGTRALAATCMTAGKPFFVLTSELKITEMDRLNLSRLKKDVDGVPEYHQIFEYTPLDLVDDIVTNRRIVPPASLSWK
ncbi:MAG TPA: hypothetical protein VLH13_00270 [Methanomassiliicoccales archaeon]|nr:hypothetical protein [Methanomassiliicoccales archaeon]